MSSGLDESAFYPPNLSGSKSRVPAVIRVGSFAADRYVTTHPQYADSASYAGRFRQLQSRALSTIRAKANQILRHAAEQVTLLLRLHMWRHGQCSQTCMLVIQSQAVRPVFVVQAWLCHTAVQVKLVTE